MLQQFQNPLDDLTELKLRPPEIVMDIERLGAMHQTRLSFVRSIVRKIMHEKWHIETQLFDLDRDGYGTCIYTVRAQNMLYSLVVFSQPLDDEERIDRVIATKWDIACALCEGELSGSRIDKLRKNVPKQEAGHNSADVLILTRANKSTRNFDHFVECLAQGKQPDPGQISKVGYLYRTTAVYGNGKFGIASYEKVKQKSAFPSTFSAQMFTVYMLRHFSVQQIEHVAYHKSPATAVTLNDELKRFIGIGNATGLGMAPFLIKHPKLIHAWLHTRELALAKVVQTASVSDSHLKKLLALTSKAILHFEQTHTHDERQDQKNKLVIQEMGVFRKKVQTLLANDLSSDRLSNIWQSLIDWAVEQTSLETQELINSLLLELHPELVDPLEDQTGADETYHLEPEMTATELIKIIEDRYRWALDIDLNRPDAQHYFWYRSIEKGEPRLGERGVDPGEDKEMDIAIGRPVKQLYQQLQLLPCEDLDQSMVLFLLEQPAFKQIVCRVQAIQDAPYGEIQGNLIDKHCLPTNLLRCKLSYFGASKFDPKSERWIRITLFQGAPLVSDIGKPFLDDWCFPCQPSKDRDRG